MCASVAVSMKEMESDDDSLRQTAGTAIFMGAYALTLCVIDICRSSLRTLTLLSTTVVVCDDH